MSSLANFFQFPSPSLFCIYWPHYPAPSDASAAIVTPGARTISPVQVRDAIAKTAVATDFVCADVSCSLTGRNQIKSRIAKKTNSIAIYINHTIRDSVFIVEVVNDFSPFLLTYEQIFICAKGAHLLHLSRVCQFGTL